MNLATLTATAGSTGALPPPLCNGQITIAAPVPEAPQKQISDAERLLGLYHQAAKGVQDAVFVLTCIEPARQEGAKDSVNPYKFDIGDVKKMADEARDRGASSNVYFGPALMRRNLPRGNRGGKLDARAVLAVVLDDDGDSGNRATLPPGIQPSFIVRSSSVPAINNHVHFVFRRPLQPSEAMELAELAYRKCGGDHGSKDIAHVWRVPETLNFPNLTKVEKRGRPKEPQPVELVGGTGTFVDVDAFRAALEKMPDAKPAKAAKPKCDAGEAEWRSGGSKDRDEILKRLSSAVQAKMNEEGEGDRSKHCFSVMLGLFTAGLTDDEVRIAADGAPFARKFEDRLDEEIRRARAKWRETDHSESKSPLPDGYRYRKGNIEYREKDGVEDDKGWTYLCSAVEFVAVTRNAEGKGWGLAMRIKTPDGSWNGMTITQAMGMDQKVFFASLYDNGLVLPPQNRNRFLGLVSFAAFSTKKRLCCVDHIGWHDRSDGSFFALPGQTFGAPDGEEIVYQPQWNEKPSYRTNGTLKSWQDGVAQYAIGNSRLAFAISAGFAGPLLYLVGEEGGGFHFQGQSSVGKTTLLRAAASIWDGGGINGAVGTWRSTDNAMEGTAWAHHDTLLTLDEINQVRPDVAYHVAYMLSNGKGKARLTPNAALKQSYEFRVLFLSTGEIQLADKIAESGGSAMAGQAVRVLDIPADAGSGRGIFEDPHGLEPGALADAIKANSARTYGQAGREFLQRLTSDTEAVKRRVKEHMRAFEAKSCPAGADGQVRRVCQRFALVSAAGELATVFGVLPWQAGEATRAAKNCFAAWLDGRGSSGSLEMTQAISHMKSIIEQHGLSRFQAWDGFKSASGSFVNNQLGYVKENEFYFFPETFKKEVCKGRDQAVVFKALKEAKALVSDENRNMKLVRLPRSKVRQRFIVVDAAKLLGDEVAPVEEEDEAPW
jgi:putative DNA primase/helicase